MVTGVPTPVFGDGREDLHDVRCGGGGQGR